MIVIPSEAKDLPFASGVFSSRATSCEAKMLLSWADISLVARAIEVNRPYPIPASCGNIPL
jgi:hypothetical protein